MKYESVVKKINRRKFLFASSISISLGAGVVLKNTILSGKKVLSSRSISSQLGSESSLIKDSDLEEIQNHGINDDDRGKIYNEIFIPNKHLYVNGWGQRFFGEPGLFKVE